MATRLYSVNSIYLGSVQKGIQTIHAYNELLRSIDDMSDSQVAKLDAWSTTDNTVIMLDDRNILTKTTVSMLGAFLDKIDVPHGYFEEPTLNDTITSFCFIIDDERRLNYNGTDPLFAFHESSSMHNMELLMIEIFTRLRLSV